MIHDGFSGPQKFTGQSKFGPLLQSWSCRNICGLNNLVVAIVVLHQNKRGFTNLPSVHNCLKSWSLIEEIKKLDDEPFGGGLFG